MAERVNIQEHSKIKAKELAEAVHTITRMKEEVGKAFFGHEEIVNSLMISLLCNGHTLVEGVPGIAKTLLIKSLAQVSGCSFSRIQFTVDLLPTDILGLTVYKPNNGFEVIKGPIFANFIIADEINRSPPKTQSALIEAMQEEQVTIGKKTYTLPRPFLVMASQNPLESEGVYTLPEAQIDRFLFKIVFQYPQREVEKKIMEHNATFKKFDEMGLKPVITSKRLIELQKLIHKVYLSDKVKEYILDIVEKTRTKDFKHGSFIELGASPRATIGLFITAKAAAFVAGRDYVLPQDVRAVAPNVLRHRISLTYQAQAEGIDTNRVITELMKTLKVS